ncbi:MAG: outer membrane beta-barrel protein [Bacteroidales bacterium]|nr:outer membrane beta-barrel protein [Bacteroidales bacterium]
MKRMFLMLVVLLMAVVGSYAQEQVVGWNLNYSTKNQNFGVGVKYRFYVADYFRLEPSADYFFENKDVSNWDVNCNLHFLFRAKDDFYLYPLVGASFAAFSVGPNDLNRLGLNLGGGFDWEFDRNWVATIELKYQCLKDFGQAVFSAGVAYCF